MVHRRVIGSLVIVPVASILIAGIALVSSVLIFQFATTSFAIKPLAVNSFPVSSERVKKVSLFVVGDVMLDRNVADKIRTAKDDGYPFRLIASDKRFSGADVRIMNLEGPVTDKRLPPEKSIDFAFPSSHVAMLRAVGFDAASQANNHGWDQGASEADASRSRLREGGIVAFGDEVQEGSVSLQMMRVRSRSIALVGFNETSNILDEKAAASVMSAARGADTVIVFMHWGEEYRDHPTDRQKSRAAWLVDHGASIVIGGHPHWTQGIEIIKGRLIVYSLGNFVFDQNWSDETRKGLAIELSLSDNEIGIDLLPVWIEQSQPRFLEGEEFQSRLREISLISDVSLKDQIQQGRITVP
jgi:poly-gamma-glutamate synthesis protein (capsule biosynthesis protein)